MNRNGSALYRTLPFLLSLQIAAQHLQGIVHAVDMAALVAMAGVNTRADKAMADITARPECGLHIRAIEGIHVNRIVRLRFFRRLNELAHHLVAVGAAGILGADGAFPLGAA